MTKYIDLTNLLFDSMPVFPGDVAFNLTKTHNVSTDGWSNYKFSTGIHIGTHVDAPAHFIENGKRINEIPIENLCGDAVVIDVRNCDKISSEQIKNINIPEQSIVIFCTGYYKNILESSYYYDYPVLTEDLCQLLIQKKIKMICLDTPSPEKSPYLLHPIILSAGIPIVENLTNTESLLGLKNLKIFALPIKMCTDGAPARVIAQYESSPELNT